MNFMDLPNKYLELKKQHETEINEFPMFVAFTEEQFKKGLTKLGLDPEITDKELVESLITIGPAYILKKDKDRYINMQKSQHQDHQDAIAADTTGNGYIHDMFVYELMNHEYSYSHNLEETFEALGLTASEIQDSPALINGVESARKEYLEAGDYDYWRIFEIKEDVSSQLIDEFHELDYYRMWEPLIGNTDFPNSKVNQIEFRVFNREMEFTISYDNNTEEYTLTGEFDGYDYDDNDESTWEQDNHVQFGTFKTLAEVGDCLTQDHYDLGLYEVLIEEEDYDAKYDLSLEIESAPPLTAKTVMGANNDVDNNPSMDL